MFSPGNVSIHWLVIVMVDVAPPYILIPILRHQGRCDLHELGIYNFTVTT